MKNILAGILFAVVLIGCASAPPPRMVITTEPAGADVSVDDQLIGISPREYQFDFANKAEYLVIAKKEGYFTETLEVNQAVLQAAQNNLQLTSFLKLKSQIIQLVQNKLQTMHLMSQK